MMMNYKKLKNGFSMAELLVALSIFAIISTIGVGALSYMLRTQYQNQTELEKELLKKARASSCLKKIYYSSCNLAIPDDSKCADQYIQTSCLN
jgi:prepilin-type N-terminal cleavage/methylation domain-containing protein